MGFEKTNTGTGNWITFKKGVMMFDGAEVPGFTGQLVELDISPDEYEGKPYQKLTLHLWDEDSECLYQMQMSMTSGYGFSFFAMCPNIDTDVLLSISSGMTKLENGNKSGNLFLKQQGKNLKWFYSKKNNPKEFEKIPKPKELKKATKTTNAILDYEARDNFIEKILTAFQKNKLTPKYPKGKLEFASRSKSGNSTNNNRRTPGDVTEPVDDLPF